MAEAGNERLCGPGWRRKEGQTGMTVAEYIAAFLREKGVTDVFGIPGGAVLDLVYAFDRTEGLSVHLSYHEQCAAFAAGGYAQCGEIPGAVFATKGPGIMNTITAVADAYYDSSAVLVFTGHGSGREKSPVRMMDNQEIDLEPLFGTITKAYISVDELGAVRKDVERACETAVSGRRGPVVVDIRTDLFPKEMPPDGGAGHVPPPAEGDVDDAVRTIARALAASERPVILAGEGVSLSGTERALAAFAEREHIPVLTSRYAEDLMPRSGAYYGYIGTHAVRSANFILSKADLIVGLGNRMAFPVRSASFRPLVENTKVIRVDVDPCEFAREVPNAVNIRVDLRALLPALAEAELPAKDRSGWLAVCDRTRDALADCDTAGPVALISDVLKHVKAEYVITSDVGNNEMWLSRAYIAAGIGNRIIYSRSFGALGCSLAKAIGAFYATKSPVVCVCGDQGFQLNLQELQAIAVDALPIVIVLLNNRSSGMIREHEELRFGKRHLLTTEDSGYAPVNARKIADAYGIAYRSYNEMTGAEIKACFEGVRGPLLLEVGFDAGFDVTPTLKKGEPCQKLFPYIDESLYNELDSL